MKYLAILLLSFLVACGGGSEEKKDGESNDKDTTKTADTNTTDVDVKEATENPEEISIEEFEKTGEGLSLCDCVKKIKEYDDILNAENTSDADFDKAMADKEKLVDGDCKIIKMGGQGSPEERAERQRQIKACK